jgi:hypothetical protein
LSGNEAAWKQFSEVLKMPSSPLTNLNVTEANDAASKICDLLPEQLTGGFFSIHNENCNRACRDIMKETLNGKSTIRKYLVKCGRKGSPLHKVSLWPNLCHGGAYFRCKNPAKR